VPDLDQATEFFVRVLGCTLVYRTSEFADTFGGDWMSRHYDVAAGAGIETVMLRCGPVTNIELFGWRGIPAPPAGVGIGAAHLALFVDDVDAACERLTAEPGVRVLGPPTTIVGEPNEGTTFVFVRLPWGLYLELVRSPRLMPYHGLTGARMYRVHDG
jgi:catechol 2,3-dioxygenase-like lactoylglutathione lyase family enzyme